MDKQIAGFKYGKYATKVIRDCGQLTVNGRIYKLVYLQTTDGQYYYSVRLYNLNGHFIKQLLFEPEALPGLIRLFESEKRG